MTSQGFRRNLLFLIGFNLWSSAGHAGIVLHRPDNSYLLLVKIGDQMLQQECGTTKPRASLGPQAQKACEVATQKKPYEQAYRSFEKSFQALHGVPTIPGESNTLERAALEEERAFRSPDQSEVKTAGSGPNVSTFARIQHAYDTYLEYVETGEKYIPQTELFTQDLLLASYWPVFSDGEIVVRVTEQVGSDKFASTCPTFWTPMSVMVASNLNNREYFKTWLEARLPTEKLTFWSAHYWLGRYTVSNSDAYQDEGKLVLLTINDSYLKGNFPAPSPTTWNRALKDLAMLTPFVTEYENANHKVRMFCFRRSFPEQFTEATSDPNHLTLTALASRYKQKDLKRFQRIALQFPAVERSLGVSAHLNATVSDAQLAAVDDELKAFFQPEYARVEEVRATIAKRQEEEAERQRIARENQLAEQRIEQARRDLEYQRQQRAQQYSNSNSSRSGGYSTGELNDGTGFTVEGVHYSSTRDYERRNPGWYWNEARGKFVGPATSGSSSSSSRSSRYSDDDEWTTLRLSPSYSTRTYSSKGTSIRTYSSGSGRTTIRVR